MIENTLRAKILTMLDEDINFITEEIALNENSKGMKIFNEPLIGFAKADDQMFNKLKDESIIGEHFRLPLEWFSSGKTVISVFFPFTNRIREENAKIRDWPAPEWLHGRIEGQNFINYVMKELIKELENMDIRAIEPAKDNRFFSRGSSPTDDKLTFTSNWSERHVAFVCGLGTFCLSKGLITKKGVAGRFASLIIDVEIESSVREYSNYDEY